jgi:hypothetical protein
MHTGGIGKGKETKSEWMCSLSRSEYNNLKLAEASTGRGLGSSEEVW